MIQTLKPLKRSSMSLNRHLSGLNQRLNRRIQDVSRTRHRVAKIHASAFGRAKAARPFRAKRRRHGGQLAMIGV
ncbi:hypothetical protein [Bosea vaviloviae]|uniref:hypothetical protein n=1 Tax=Bosea vaviloviae TaxID=1526658 RepID=UPI001314B80E|nr:hypothetical protein [Bosea vaviloviae]